MPFTDAATPVPMSVPAPVRVARWCAGVQAVLAGLGAVLCVVVGAYFAAWTDDGWRGVVLGLAGFYATLALAVMLAVAIPAVRLNRPGRARDTLVLTEVVMLALGAPRVWSLLISDEFWPWLVPPAVFLCAGAAVIVALTRPSAVGWARTRGTSTKA